MGVRPGQRVNAKAGEWAARLAARLNPDDALRISQRMLDAVDEVSRNRWDAATERAAALPGDVRPEKIKALTDSFARELGAAGAAVGVVAVSPAVGAAATMMATTAELGWFTARAGDLILTIAAVHGRPEPTLDERRAWVLAVLIYGSSARHGLAGAVNEATTGIAPMFDRRVPLVTLQTANRMMSRALLRRYGSRRGLIAVGRALPIGVGALIGGSANYVAVRTLARNADQFFARLPYSAIDAEATDVTDRLLGR